jgi:hypothetical protein
MGGAAGAMGCPSNTVCGAQADVCCAAGEECVDAACKPACASGVRCGDLCCDAGDVCLSGACAAPGKPCKDSFDCLDGQFCEPTLGKCLDQPVGVDLCEFRPPVQPFAPVLEWSWTGSPIKPDHDQVLSIPLVGDLDADGSPDLAIVTHDKGDGACDTGHAYIRAIDGRDGTEKWAADVDAYTDAARVALCRNPALADLDGDGKPEIIAARFGGGLVALHGDGSLAWTSTQADKATPFTTQIKTLAAVSVANMDGDGKPEIVVGGAVFNSDGSLRSGAALLDVGSNGLFGANSVIADIDGNGVQDIVGGNVAVDIDGATLWNNNAADGYAAIADLDLDGKPEVVVISAGFARVQDAATGVVLATIDMPGTGNGGPPTISDFDGDGVPDFASAVGDSYTVFTYVSKPAPAIAVVWSVPTLDISSSRTGSSVFDFEDDGKAEVLYNDECYLRVYDGTSGTVLFETASSSGTAAQYPIAVDADGDGNTELVVVSDDKYQIAGITPGCPKYKAGEKLRHGVFVYGDSNDQWVGTRKVWNQHAYHITNVKADGSLPLPEVASWGPQGQNNYRVSSQGTGVSNAPDLTVDVTLSTVNCPASLLLRARVKNVGSLGVKPGVEVAFYQGKDTGGTLLGMAVTKTGLLPGASEIVELPAPQIDGAALLDYYVEVDEGPLGGSVAECHEDNNTASVSGASCGKI